MSKVNGEREKGLKEIVVCMPAETQQHIPVWKAGADGTMVSGLGQL